jgi:hypothetical protein
MWQDQNGNWRASYEMTAFDVKFLGQRGGEGGSFEGAASDSAGSDAGMSEEEIPF